MLKALGERIKNGEEGENRRLSRVFYLYLDGPSSENYKSSVPFSLIGCISQASAKSLVNRMHFHHICCLIPI
jgi:hypothetical protein